MRSSRSQLPTAAQPVAALYQSRHSRSLHFSVIPLLRKTLWVVVTNSRGTACRGIFRRLTHYLGCVHSNIFRGGTVQRAENANERHTSPLSLQRVWYPKWTSKATRTRAGLGREYLSRRCDLSTQDTALNHCGRLTGWPARPGLLKFRAPISLQRQS